MCREINYGSYLCNNMSGKTLPIFTKYDMKRDYSKEMYMVVHLDGRAVGDDLSDCLKITCSNKRALSIATGIRYFRLVYVFKKPKEGKGRSYLVENGMLILKSELYYKGSQPGGLVNPALRRNNF